MSSSKIDKLCYLWQCSMIDTGSPPFSNYQELYQTIDATQLGDVQWSNFKLRYNGERPTDSIPPWMDASYEFWFRDPCRLVVNMLSNPEFDGEMDYVPYRDFTTGDEKRRFENFMSGDWAWMQAVTLPSYVIVDTTIGIYHRTKSLRILQLTGPPLFRLFLVATRRRSLLPRAKMTTGPYTCLLVIFTTMFGVLTAMESNCLRSSLSRKVWVLVFISLSRITD